MGLFKKKTVTKTYDKENKKPVIKASIKLLRRKMVLEHIFFN